MPYKLHIQATSVEDVEKAAVELLEVLTGLRESTKKWDLNYGHYNLREKKRWQTKADNLIEKYKIKVDE
jgi:hypothetical protein